MLVFLLVAIGTYFFLEGLFFTVGFLNADLEAKALARCEQHIWPTEGPMICQRCRKNPSDDMASAFDFEIDE